MAVTILNVTLRIDSTKCPNTGKYDQYRYVLVSHVKVLKYLSLRYAGGRFGRFRMGERGGGGGGKGCSYLGSVFCS